MYTPAPLPTLKNQNGHDKATMDMMQNAVHVGKYSESDATALLDLAAPDPDIVQTLKEMVGKKKINPASLEGQYHPKILKQAVKPWDEISQKEPGGISTIKKNAPEIYKAKFFEKYGRMPAC